VMRRCLAKRTLKAGGENETSWGAKEGIGVGTKLANRSDNKADLKKGVKWGHVPQRSKKRVPGGGPTLIGSRGCDAPVKAPNEKKNEMMARKKQ